MSNSKTMRFILRHDTLQNWKQSNPVLMNAELVFVEEDGAASSVVIGDGVHPFTQLPRIALQEGLSAKIVLDVNGNMKLCVFADKLKKEEESEAMSDNYIVINGKKAELTNEQMKALGIAPDTKNPCARVERGGTYYYIDSLSNITVMRDDSQAFDQCYVDTANYFNEREFAQKVNLQQLLYRKLLKYAYDTGTIDDQPWDGKAVHYTINYSDEVGFSVGEWVMTWRPGTVYFKTRQAARNAIRDVMEPFMKDHPEFLKEARNVSKN